MKKKPLYVGCTNFPAAQRPAVEHVYSESRVWKNSRHFGFPGVPRLIVNLEENTMSARTR
jgi:hypothetical protein